MHRLARFAALPFLAEGPAGRAAMAVAACLAASPVAAAPSASPDATGYRDAVRTVQAGLDAWLGKGRAVVADRSAPGASEAARLRKVLGGRDAIDEFTLGAVAATPGKVCLVVGEDPSADARDILSVKPLATAAAGDVSYRDAQVYGLWRVAAMCGFDAAAPAAAMAVLATARDTRSRDLPGLAAASADLADWVDPAGGIVGQSVARAAAKASAMRDAGRMASAPYGQIAREAAAIGGLQPSRDTVGAAYEGLVRARSLKAWYAPVREGAVAVDFRSWLGQSSVPAARHYASLVDYVEGRGRERGPVPPLLTDTGVGPRGTANYAASDARLGDNGAAAFADPETVRAVEEAVPGSVVPPKALASWDGMRGERIPFDRATERLAALGDGTAFAVFDRASGKEVGRGSAEHGLLESEPEPTGPRP